jgi:hypothetical protein
VQNWYAGDENGKGGIYNFVTKRGLCKGDNSKISWTQAWAYPRTLFGSTLHTFCGTRWVIALHQ